MKLSGDSGSTLSASTFFALSCTMLVAGTDGTISLSRVADWTIAFGILNAFLAALSGKTSARSLRTIHQHSSGSVTACISSKPRSRQTTDKTHFVVFSIAIDSSRSVNCSRSRLSQCQHSRIYTMQGYSHRAGFRYWESPHPQEQLVFQIACHAFEFIRGSDVMDAIAELEDA